MTIRRHRILWFFAVYGFSLIVFAVLMLLVRVLLRCIVTA